MGSLFKGSQRRQQQPQGDGAFAQQFRRLKGVTWTVGEIGGQFPLCYDSAQGLVVFRPPEKGEPVLQDLLVFLGGNTMDMATGAATVFFEGDEALWQRHSEQIPALIECIYKLFIINIFGVLTDRFRDPAPAASATELLYMTVMMSEASGDPFFQALVACDSELDVQPKGRVWMCCKECIVNILGWDIGKVLGSHLLLAERYVTHQNLMFKFFQGYRDT